MSNNIYQKFNIDISKLNRDYIQNPLKKIIKRTKNNKAYIAYEYINKDDLYYLYIVCRLSAKILSNYIFNISTNTITNQIKFYNFTKSRKQSEEDKKYTNKIIYGVENVMQLNYIKEKMYNTNINKYGSLSSMQNDEVKKKREDNNIIKYGVKNVMQIKEIYNKMLTTTIKRYGTKCIVAKNISKEEQKCFNMLKEKFPDAIQQYYNENRYPFFCDMYIPSKDIFIEYQGYAGGHFNRPYKHTEKDVDDLLELILNQDTKPFNKRIIETWAANDIIKREKAKESKIQLLEFYNIKDFKSWLKGQ